MTELAVLIAVHNAQEALIRTLRSLDRQTCEFDIFVADDCSMPPIAIDPQEFRHKIRLLKMTDNQGPFAAANLGLQQIMQNGYRFVARQDAGDVDADGRLESQMAFLKAHPAVMMVGAWVKFVDAAGKQLFLFQPPVDTHGIRRRMRYSSAVIHPASMIRLDALRAIGVYSDEYRLDKGGFVGGDYELFFRLASSFECANIPEYLVIKEESPGTSVSVDKRRESVLSRMKTQLKYFDPFSPHSYAGLLCSCLMYAIPYSAWAKIKSHLKVMR
jgi:glycosyltransferase involved in cell wall biosynthesis